MAWGEEGVYGVRRRRTLLLIIWTYGTNFLASVVWKGVPDVMRRRGNMDRRSVMRGCVKRLEVYDVRSETGTMMCWVLRWWERIQDLFEVMVMMQRQSAGSVVLRGSGLDQGWCSVDPLQAETLLS